MEDKILLGRRVRELRRARGLSQDQLSEKSSLSPKYLSSIERGVENPTLDLLTRLAAGLQVTMMDLFNFEWVGMTEDDLRRKIIERAEVADLGKLRELLAMMRARGL